MKLSSKSTCPFCNNKYAIRKGMRKNKLRTIQKLKCKNCRKYFTAQSDFQKHKTYPANIIINTASNLNLGYSLKQTSNYFKTENFKKTKIKKRKIPKTTLSRWYSILKQDLPYHKLRQQIKQHTIPSSIIKKKMFIHHNQPFLYQYHKPKINLLLHSHPKLKHYLENIQRLLPKGIFNNSQRISALAKKQPIKIILPEPKQNCATRLANLAMQITKQNNQRHHVIENLMLKNDTATIAVEIPVYTVINNQTLTGHIDMLQIRSNKIYILDFKTEKINTQQAAAQVYLYTLALSRITNAKLNKFRCGFFSSKEYYEFEPEKINI